MRCTKFSEIKADHLIPNRRLDLVIVDKKEKEKKGHCRPSGFCCPSGFQDEYQRKRKERQELRHFQRTFIWNFKLTVIPVVNGAFGGIPKGLIKGLKELEIEGAEIIKTTALLWLDRILRRVLET